MKNSTLKIVILFFLLLSCLTIIANLTISSTLNSNAAAIKHALEKSLGFGVSFTEINFGILNGIQFKNFAIYKDSQKIFFLKDLRVYPSFKELFRGRVRINKVLATEGITYTDVLKYKDYLISKIENFKKQDKDNNRHKLMLFDFRHSDISLRDLRIFLGNPVINRGYVLVKTDIVTQLENFTAKTTLDFRACDFEKTFLKNIVFYEFSHKVSIFLQLAFMRDDLLVNNIVFSSDNIKINGAGIIYDFKSNPVIDVKLITIPLNLRELIKLKSQIAASGLLSIVTNLKGGLDTFRLYTEMLMSKGELYFPKNIVRVSNVFCNINFKNNEIIIKELSGLINYTIPIFITGKLRDFLNPEINFSIEYHKSKRTEPLNEEASSFLFKIKSRLNEKEFTGDASLAISLTNQIPHLKKIREVNIQFGDLSSPLSKDLILDGIRQRSFDFVSKRLIITNKLMLNDEVKNQQDLEFGNFRARFLLDRFTVIKAQAHCLGYDGLIETAGQWDFSGNNPNNYFMTKFTDLAISDLKSLFPVNSDISGFLNGWLYFRKDDSASLEGAFAIKEADIAKFNLFNNIGDFLGIQSLKELEGMSLFTSFEADSKGVNVKRFNMYNDSLALDGRFNMNNNGWLSGETNLTLSKNILNESNILRTLLNMVKETREKIDFDFRVSGFPNGLRVELLEGEFRDKLMSGLSGSIRSQIDNEIDKAIKSFRETGKH